jgi:glycosyltransferase involved in cell wall biosynthesis
MSDDRFDRARLDELAGRAELREYEFASAAPGVGDLVARFRAAWNSVATKWQVRPMIEQQSAFNAALVEWLARRQMGQGVARERDPVAERVAHDRGLTDLNREVAAVGAQAARQALSPTLSQRARGRGALSLTLSQRERERRSPSLWEGIGEGRPADGAARRLRVAYFSPLPPAHSGIADYSTELLPALAALADVTLFSDAPISPGGLPRRPLDAFPAERWAFDLPLYQMGNSAHHAEIYRMLRRFPGVTVLHDFHLHHLLAHLTLGAGRFADYAREIEYALGDEAAPLLRDIRSGRAANPLYDVALNERLLDSSLGLIVHSQTVAAWIRAARPAARVAVIPHLVVPRPARSRRAALNLPPEAFLLAVVGQVTAAKQLPLALRAFQRLLAFAPQAYFLIVGEALPEVDLDETLRDLGLGERVIRLDYVESFDAFVDWAATADVVLNLRYPTLGETSGAALRVMAAGRPLVVFDHGWYGELPDEVAVKVPPLDEEALLAALLELARDPERRAALGAAAARYVATQCAPAAVADAYVEFIAALEPAA